MSDSFRLRVAKAISDALKTVRLENGYQHDMADYVDADGIVRPRVFRGRLDFGDSDPLPMLVLLEDPEIPKGSGAQSQVGQPVLAPMHFLIQGIVADDPDNALDPAYALSAEAIKAIALGKAKKFGLGDRINTIFIDPPVHRPPDMNVSAKAYFIFGLRLTIIEKPDDPFF